MESTSYGVGTTLGGSADINILKDPSSDWTYTELTFDTGENDSQVKLFYYYEPGTNPNHMYLDELTLNKVADLYSVTATAENGVAYKSQLAESAEGGTEVTFVCAPDKQDATFEGWYNGGVQVSTERTFTTTVTADCNLTAKFTGGTEIVDTATDDEIKAALLEGNYETLFKRAIKNTGNQALLAKLFKKAQSRQDITIVGLGGSITQGAGADAKENSYGSLVAAWLQNEFPTITVTYVNAGIGSTTSDLGLARMQAQVLDYNPDLVIVDFTTNDQDEERYRYTYEGIIRKLMEKQIATVAIMFGPSTNYNAENVDIERRANRTDLHLPSLLYYDIPVIDYFDAIWDYLDSNDDGVNNSDDTVLWTNLWSDYIHPNNAGHKLSSNAINYYLSKVLSNVESIDTTVPAVPQELFYAKTASYIGSTMYDSRNIDAKLTASKDMTIENYGNKDANTMSYWETWKISEGGYIEFTLPSCKSFTILRVQQPNGGKANITINGELFKQDNSYQASGQLNWASSTYYGDGVTPTTIRIECVDDGDNTKDTFYQISCVFIAE